ncbi:hypothetical protein NDU88_003248 [Pleurodeles waltl]|uniref:Uncharacterized protein n=1 Tax=Pleurodeles waltl TaxID=8319 RepID=A0AAV7LRL1_PLEWA|nr:hypothetical protein NDU88_003248 [Pleurodeles waltl]
MPIALSWGLQGHLSLTCPLVLEGVPRTAAPGGWPTWRLLVVMAACWWQMEVPPGQPLQLVMAAVWWRMEVPPGQPLQLVMAAVWLAKGDSSWAASAVGDGCNMVTDRGASRQPLQLVMAAVWWRMEVPPGQPLKVVMAALAQLAWGPMTAGGGGVTLTASVGVGGFIPSMT